MTDALRELRLPDEELSVRVYVVPSRGTMGADGRPEPEWVVRALQYPCAREAGNASAGVQAAVE